MTQESAEVKSPGKRGRNDNVEARFFALVNQWREETGALSSPTRKAAHPAYQQIIAMGKQAVPLILQEMKDHPGHWSMALQSITGENPVPEEAAGHAVQVANAWLEWGRKNGYLN